MVSPGSLLIFLWVSFGYHSILREFYRCGIVAILHFFREYNSIQIITIFIHSTRSFQTYIEVATTWKRYMLNFILYNCQHLAQVKIPVGLPPCEYLNRTFCNSYYSPGSSRIAIIFPNIPPTSSVNCHLPIQIYIFSPSKQYIYPTPHSHKCKPDSNTNDDHRYMYVKVSTKSLVNFAFPAWIAKRHTITMLAIVSFVNGAILVVHNNYSTTSYTRLHIKVLNIFIRFQSTQIEILEVS